jgi:hypothetical protein
LRLEGTLDAFSLPDIFQLLSYTKKTGTLHLRRDGQHGVVHLRDGAVTGGRGDVTRQALGRRLVGAGLVDDDALADAAERVMDEPSLGLARLLVDAGRLPADIVLPLAVEQASDAVFELLRWPDGEFAFVMDEQDPDDVGASLPVEEVVAEGTRRMAAWSELADRIPSVDAVVSVLPAPDADPVVTRDEWALLALVNGARTVSDLVALAGKGEFVVVSALAALADRGLVAVGAEHVTHDPQAQRLQVLSALEGRPVPAAAPEVPAVPQAREPERAGSPAPVAQERRQVIPERPEPFTPSRRPEHAEPPAPAFSRYAAAQPTASAAPAAPASSAPVTATQGAHALATDPVASSYIDRDPAVNKSLLLRLIAGVRGL